MSRVRPVRSGHDTLTPNVGFGAVVSLTSPLLTDAETMASDTSIPEMMADEDFTHDALIPDSLVTNTSNRDAKVPKSTPRGTVSEGSTRDAASNPTNSTTNHYSRPRMPKSQTTLFENNPSLPGTDYSTTTSLMPNSTSMPTFLLTPSSTVRPRPTRRPPLYSDHHTVPPDASNHVPAVPRPPSAAAATSYDHHTPLPPPRAAPSPSTPLSLLSPSSPQFYLDHTPATSLPHLSPTTPQSYNNHISDTPGFQSVLSPTSCQSDKGHSPNTSTFQLSISSTTPLTNTCNTPTTASAHSFPTSPQSSHSPNTTTLPHLSPTTPQSHPSHSPVTPQTYSSHTTHSNPMSHTSDGIPNDSASGPILNILSPNVVDLTNTREKESSLLPSPSFPTPSPSFLTEDGTEVRVEDLIHLGSGEGTRVREGRSGSRKGRIRAAKPQNIEKKRNREKRTDKTLGRETSKGEILEDANVRRKNSDDRLYSKERDLEACWTHLLSPHFLSPPPSPTSSISGLTKNDKSDLNTEGCVEPECKREVFKNILYDEGSDETDDCGRLLKKEKKERKRLKKQQKRLKKAQQAQSREPNGPIHKDNQATTKKKRRRKHRHGERPTPLDLLSDEHDHGNTRDDPTPPCFRRLNLPMIDDDPGHDYRLPDPSSTPSSTSSSSSSSSSSSGSSSSLSFDLDILGPEAAEWAEQLADVTVGAGCFIKEEMEEVVHILTEPEDWLEFEWFDAITGLVSIVTFYFDLVSDGLVLYYMTDDPASKRFFLPTLLLTVIPMVLANGFSLYWYWFDERGCGGNGCHPRPSASRKVWTLRLVAHTLLQASVLREVDIIYYGTKSTAETVLEEAPVNEVMTEALRQTPTPTPPITTTTTTTRPVFTANTSKNRCGGGWCVRRGGYVALWLHSERDAANVELILALLRDAPLLLLHLYALELTLPSQIVQGAISHTLVMQMLSVVMSFLELAWAVASYIRASHLTEPSLPNFSYLAVFLLTLTHFCNIAGQVMSLSLCASRVLSVFFVVAGIHWGLMSAWIFFQLVFEPRTTCTRALFPHDKVQGSCQRLDDALYSLVMGLVFLFTFVDVGGAPSATRARLYQVFTLFEQLSLLTVWLVLSPEWAWYHMLPVVLSPLLFCFSLTFDTLLSIHITPTHCIPLAPPSSSASSKNIKIKFTSPKSV
ncbi:hypothetical protein Pmani_035316 [Petrolisthes manimaculis]|uniref:XK-related protein n=1 Tax=Petrolisthes manimaculis TaxID=1843537 RepID=A0AAE1NKR0_9EUCA|nr:hypothetical protein Pmani_035316 [Petrolisthes manimaculis]